MSEQAHNDPSKTWLIFFFVCFTVTVGAIGLWACFSYHVNDDNAPAKPAGHGMILPEQMPHHQQLSIG